MIRFAILFALLTSSATSFAAEAPAPTVFDEEEAKKAPAASNAETAAALQTMQMMPSIFDADARIDALAKRVANLEKTRVTAAQARAIAKEEIAKVTVALRAANGTIRTQSVSVGSNLEGSIVLGPNETFAGWVNPQTGQFSDASMATNQYQRVHTGYSQPVQYWEDSSARFATTEPTANYRQRRLFFRPQPAMQTWMRSSGNCAGGVCR